MSVLKHNRQFIKFILFLLAFLPRLLICLRAFPFKILPDEFGVIGFPLYLAGKDFTHMIAENIGYYGAGFSLFFTPVFLFVDNPIIQYRIILIICMLLQSLVVLIAFYFSEEFLPNNPLWVKILLSLASSFFVQTKLTCLNEHPLILLCWLIALVMYFILKNREDRVKWNLYSAALLVLICYALTVHTRAIAIFLVLIAVILLYWIFERDWFISPGVFIIIGALGYFFSKCFVKIVRDTIWQTETGDFLGNTSVFSEVMLKLGRLKTPEEWPIFGNILLGQIETVTVFSGGIFLLLIVAGLIMFKRMVLNRECKDRVLWISFFFLMCIFGTILTQGITWLPDPIYEMGSNDNRVKAFMYIRYLMPYCGPVFIIVFCYLLQPGRQIKGIVRKAIPFYCFVTVCFVIFAIPYLYGLAANRFILEVFRSYFLSEIEGATVLAFIPGILVSNLFFIIYVVLAEKKALKYALIPITAILIYFYIFNSLSVDYFYQRLSYQIADGGYSAICKLEENVMLPEKIYLQNEIDSDHDTVQFEYQFLLQNHEIVNSLPEQEIEEAIVLSDVSSGSEDFYNMIMKGYRAARLDENEIIFVRGDNLIKAVSNSGLPLYDNFYEWIDISNQGITENAVFDNNGKISSYGEEGYIIDGQNVTVIPGKIEVQFDLSVNPTEENKAGTVDIYNATTGKVLCFADITVNSQIKSDVHISLSSACCGDDKLSFRVYANKDCQITVNNIQYVHSDNIYEIGADRYDEFAEMRDFISRITGDKQLKYLIRSVENKSQLSDTFLSELIGNSFTGLCSDTDIEISRPSILITAYDNWDSIWNLLEQYTIVYRTGNYSILVKNDVLDKDKLFNAGGELLSEGHRIRAKYLQMNRQGMKTNRKKINLPFGTYDILAEYRSKAKEVDGVFSFKGSGVFNAEESFEYEEGIWRAKGNIWVMFKESGISYEVMIKNADDWENVEVFFERTEPFVGIDLQLMEMDRAEIGNDGYIYSSGRKGTVMKGPFLPFGKGDYILHVVIEDFSNLPSDVIQLTIRSEGNQVVRDRVLASSLEGKEGVELTLPFSLTSDTDDMTIELHETEGTKIRVTSLFFSKE